MAITDTAAVVPARDTTATGRPRISAHLAVLFTVTSFVGAAMLFVVQPMVARLILPSYGGSATVWSTSSLFFQVLLLLGYGYAHISTTRLGRRWQPRVHVIALLVPLLALPVTVPTDAAPDRESSPVLWLLRTLLLVIGVPFVVLATTGPLIQRWYSWSNGRRAEDPYFLFAAGNLGSFAGLLAYPLVVEPHLSLAQQRSLWSWGFSVFAALTAACALTVVRSRWTVAASSGRPSNGAALALAVPLRRTRVLTWAALAFLPSSLMLGVTAHISTDIAAIPLLWVVPLGIYLATFVVAFARTSRSRPVTATRVAVALSFVVLLEMLLPGQLPVLVSVGLNLLVLALVAFAAHARLAADRPGPERLTAFYLVVAAGGAAGGLLNGVIAPMVFNRVLEYPLALIVVPLLLLGISQGSGWLVAQTRVNGVRKATVLVSVTLAILVVATAGSAVRDAGPVVVLVLAAAFVVGLIVSRLPAAMAVGMAMLYLVSTFGTAGVLEQTRTFYGSYSVRATDGRHVLVHGTTVHGTQIREPEVTTTPTTYYSRGGPLGDVMAAAGAEDIAAVGLGTGTVAAYGAPGQRMTFFEIDEEIVRIARDPRLFSYLADSDADVTTVVGDGRLALADTSPGSFDLVVLDAFSSDSIPVHLLTEEAMRLYADRLTDDGTILVHISNRVFDLEPVLASAEASLGWSAAIGRGAAATDATASVWVALSRDDTLVDALVTRSDWSRLGDRRVRWTDDYSSILSVLR